jgi:hypothetical protein
VQATTEADRAVALADAGAEVPGVAGVRAGVADPAAWPLGLAVRLPVAGPLPPAPQPASAAPASTAPAASMSHGFIVMSRLFLSPLEAGYRPLAHSAIQGYNGPEMALKPQAARALG